MQFSTYTHTLTRAQGSEPWQKTHTHTQRACEYTHTRRHTNIVKIIEDKES